jgi:hypothetical protein
VLSWYQGINLDQLEHLHEDSLSDVDLVKLCRCACAIAECANTNKLVNKGESDDDGAVDDMDFKAPGFVEASERTPEDVTGSSIPPSPDGDGFVLAARTADSAHLKPLIPRLTLSWAGALYRHLFLCLTHDVSDNIVFAHVGVVSS